MTSPQYISDYKNNQFPIQSYTRIISLVPSLTDLLFSFGLEHSIIGVTKYCTYPANAMDPPRTIVGGTKNPDIEKIIQLKPDILLMNEEENQLKHYDALVKAGIAVFVTFPKTVSETISMFYDLKNLFSVGPIPELEELEKLVSEISDQVNFLTNRKKVFCPIWKKPWMSFSKDTFASHIIEFCGGENIITDVITRYPEITIDEIIDQKPDVILLPDEPYKFTVKDREELLELFAPYEPKIELLSGTFHWYSFIMIESLHKLSALFL